MAGSHMCQHTFLHLQDYLPCKFKEGGGKQCEREEAHDDDKHWWSKHTMVHEKAGNGYACEAFEEPVAMFAYKAYLQERLQQQLDWIAEIDSRPSVP